MSQPLPFNTQETSGWWANPQSMIMPPSSHSLPSTTAIASAHTMPTAHIPAHRPNDGRMPIDGIPTVVAYVCYHALSGTDSPIGSTTISAETIALCTTCYEFQEIELETSQFYTAWQSAVSQGAPQSKRKDLARSYRKSRLLYEEASRYHQEHSDPELPIVNYLGVSLLPSLAYESQPTVTPRRRAVKIGRVRFDESQPHPSRETARSRISYWRFSKERQAKINAYVPGRYAAPTKEGWEDTSEPELYQENVSTLNDPFMRPFGFEEQGWWHTDPATAEESSWKPVEHESDQVEDTEADEGEDTVSKYRRKKADIDSVVRKDHEDSDCDSDDEDAGGPLPASSTAIYTQSSPPAQSDKGGRVPNWTSPESEK